MRIETIKKLCCPFDKAELNLTIIEQDISANVIEGFLTCKECQRIYPIVKGIPIMSPDEFREFKLEQPLIDKWEKHLKGKTIENFRLIVKGIEDN
jgi:uncharacterized protein YbaR (Trm112 family)